MNDLISAEIGILIFIQVHTDYMHKPNKPNKLISAVVSGQHNASGRLSVQRPTEPDAALFAAPVRCIRPRRDKHSILDYEQLYLAVFSSPRGKYPYF